MNRIHEILKDQSLRRYSFFIIFTVGILCVIYFIIKNFDVIAIAAGNGIGSVLSALTPFFIGLILAYLINPFVEAFDRRIMKKLTDIFHGRMSLKNRKSLKSYEGGRNRTRIISIVIVYAAIVTCLIFLMYLLASLLVGKLMLDSLPKMIESIMNYLGNYEENIKAWISELPGGILSDKIEVLANSILSWITSNLSANSVIDVLSNIIGGIVNFVIGLIISIYLIADRDFFIRLWKRFLELILPPKANSAVNDTLSEINAVLSRFLRGILLDALIVATLSSIGLTIGGLKFAVFVGIFAGICNIIPYFGPIMGMIPAFLIGFFTDGLWQGIIAVVILLVIQQIDGNLIYPKVVGSSTGLHPLFVLLAVSVGGYYGGIIGMVIAVPIAGIAKIFLQRWSAWHRTAKE